MSTSPEQKAILDKMFGGWDPFVDLEPAGKTSEWEVSAIEKSGLIKSRKYIISSGQARFEYSASSELACLSWEAKIPDYLKPGRGIEGYNEFMGFVLSSYPSLFYDFSNFEGNFPQNYLNNIHITIDPVNSSENVRKNHRLKKESDRLSFAVDFFSDGRGARGLTVNLRPDIEDDFGECHLFVTYPDAKGGGAELTVGLPLTVNAVDGWPQRAMKWTIDTHAKKEKLDLELAPRNLSETILLLSDRSYYERFGFPQS